MDRYREKGHFICENTVETVVTQRNQHWRILSEMDGTWLRYYSKWTNVGCWLLADVRDKAIIGISRFKVTSKYTLFLINYMAHQYSPLLNICVTSTSSWLLCLTLGFQYKRDCNGDFQLFQNIIWLWHNSFQEHVLVVGSHQVLFHDSWISTTPALAPGTG
jgi:hypothetical protein